MDEKEAEARPVMGTIFLVYYVIYCLSILHMVIFNVKCDSTCRKGPKLCIFFKIELLLRREE